MNPETIKSLTPIYLATLGLLLAVVAVVAPNSSNELRFSVLSLSASAFGGASGIAQQSKQQSIQGNDEVNISEK